MAAAEDDDAEALYPIHKFMWHTPERYEHGGKTSFTYYNRLCYSITIEECEGTWHLHFYSFRDASVTLPRDNNTLASALEAFGDYLLVMDRVLPHLPPHIYDYWKCRLCGANLYGKEGIRHVEEHLAMTKSASKT
jgi:hypothetical protein